MKMIMTTGDDDDDDDDTYYDNNNAGNYKDYDNYLLETIIMTIAVMMITFEMIMMMTSGD